VVERAVPVVTHLLLHIQHLLPVMAAMARHGLMDQLTLAVGVVERTAQASAQHF
jgi:hypothetical protein